MELLAGAKPSANSIASSLRDLQLHCNFASQAETLG